MRNFAWGGLQKKSTSRSLAKKTARFIEKETFGDSVPVGFNITPASLELTETAENIFLSPQAISNLDRYDL